MIDEIPLSDGLTPEQIAEAERLVAEWQPGEYELRFLTPAPTSAVGYKQTLAGMKTTSASPPGADLPGGEAEGPFLTQSGS